MKFGRFYSMFAQGHDADHTIEFPLTCRFQVDNNNPSTYGAATFLIYNLSADVRADLYKDPLDFGTYKQVIFSAGFTMDSVNPVVIFQGNITLCYSYRQGPDWITEIQGMDGAYAGDTSKIDLTIASGYTLKYAIQQLVGAMSPTVQLGLVGSLVTSSVANTRGLSLSGSPWDLLVRQMTALSLQAYIYKEKAYVVARNEYIDAVGGVTEISEETGLLGSPKMQQLQVITQQIFEPRIQVQQQIELKVQSKPMSRQYLVARCVHKGTISGAVCEDLITECTLLRTDLGLVSAQ
jgi:hypothetical protein